MENTKVLLGNAIRVVVTSVIYALVTYLGVALWALLSNGIGALTPLAIIALGIVLGFVAAALGLTGHLRFP